MTTLEIVLGMIQSIVFIVAGSYINSYNVKTKNNSNAGLIILLCGIIGLSLSLAILVFYY